MLGSDLDETVLYNLPFYKWPTSVQRKLIGIKYFLDTSELMKCDAFHFGILVADSTIENGGQYVFAAKYLPYGKVVGCFI